MYCASGSHHAGYGENSHILSHITQQKTAIGSRDFCIQPDLGLIDPQSGPSQFGRNRDAWGNWFGVQNSFPLWHYVLEDPFIRRNPHFSPPDPRHQVVTPANPPVYPAAVHEKRFHSFEQSGRFTSACSGMIYQDDLLFGPALENATDVTIEHAFTCEPFSNLVQHNVIVSDGVSFRFERDPQETAMDFLPQKIVGADLLWRTGPDGGLWIVDMYRYMIEHPQWLPQEGQDELRPFFDLVKIADESTGLCRQAHHRACCLVWIKCQLKNLLSCLKVQTRGTGIQRSVCWSLNNPLLPKHRSTK